MSLHIPNLTISEGARLGSQAAALSRFVAVDPWLVSVVELAKPPVSAGAGPDTAMGHKIKGLSENDGKPGKPSTAIGENM